MNDNLFRDSDPFDDSLSDDALLKSSRSRWKELASQRQQRLQRRQKLGRQGMAALAVLTFGVGLWFYTYRSGQVRSVAVVQPSQANPEESPSKAAVERRAEERVEVVPAEESQVVQSALPPSQPNHSLTMVAFKKELKRAGGVGSSDWKQVVSSLASSSPNIQRRSVELVSQIEYPPLQLRAVTLVSDAAGSRQKNLLADWLKKPETRFSAWRRSLQIAGPNDWTTLASMAKTESEKTQLCRELWQKLDEPLAGTLVELANRSGWRLAVRTAAQPLSRNQVLQLVMQFRDSDLATKTATAFVLASIPGQQVDQVMADMIRQGRYRQPCYLTLMSRDTAAARTFLTQAARSKHLAPALVSAQSHFGQMATELNHWKNNSKGESDEDSQKRSHVLPDFRFGKLAIVWRDVRSVVTVAGRNG